MKAKVLFDDPADRWKAGDVGDVVENTFEKYDYALDFGTLKDVEFLGKKQDFARVYFFYKDEIEILN